MDLHYKAPATSGFFGSWCIINIVETEVIFNLLRFFVICCKINLIWFEKSIPVIGNTPLKAIVFSPNIAIAIKPASTIINFYKLSLDLQAQQSRFGLGLLKVKVDWLLKWIISSTHPKLLTRSSHGGTRLCMKHLRSCIDGFVGKHDVNLYSYTVYQKLYI